MKPKKNTQKLFLIQIGLAVLCFIVLVFITKTKFYNSPKINSYLSLNDGVKKMASSTSSILDSLIIKDDVTLDPTSGKEIEKVLKYLKKTENEKFLMIGSSQLRVVKGLEKGKSGFNKIVSKKVQDFSKRKNQTYNLSLGGMTVPEKLIMLKKTSELLNPENVLISVTPWDCIADRVRKSVSDIKEKSFKNQETIKNEVGKAIIDIDLMFPLNINQNANNYLDTITNKNLFIYSKRTGINKWLDDETTSFLINVKTPFNPTNIISKFSMPDYWLTNSQKLDNKSGWDNIEFKTGKRSLKIINEEKTLSKWDGDIIFLEKPTNTFIFEGWMKAENVSSDTKLLAVDHKIMFEDNTDEWYLKNLKFDKNAKGWQQVKAIANFDKNVIAIKPHLLFYNGTGTVWFDDITINPVFDGKAEENIVPNPGGELELEERLNVSYSYNKEEWNKIKENMFSVIDHLASNKAKNKYLLLTPFWSNEKKSAYPQKNKYINLIKKVKARCKNNNVKYIDASYILNKDHFGIYTKGSVRDKIDVLHFNSEAHEILAKYIIKNLN